MKTAKTQTKTEVRNNSARIGKLLRGIDNSTQSILRDKKKLDEKIAAVQKDAKAVQTLVSGVSNTALAAMSSEKAAPKSGAAAAKPGGSKPGAEKKAAKPVPEKKPAKAAKPAPAKKPAKAAKPAPEKKAPEKKAAKPAKAPEKKATAAPGASERPPLKQVIAGILAASPGSMAAGEIYKAAVAKHGYWSRQSLYNALKDASSFVKDGDKFTVAGPAKSEADAFVDKVEQNAAVAQVS